MGLFLFCTFLFIALAIFACRACHSCGTLFSFWHTHTHKRFESGCSYRLLHVTQTIIGHLMSIWVTWNSLQQQPLSSPPCAFLVRAREWIRDVGSTSCSSCSHAFFHWVERTLLYENKHRTGTPSYPRLKLTLILNKVISSCCVYLVNMLCAWRLQIFIYFLQCSLCYCYYWRLQVKGAVHFPCMHTRNLYKEVL